MKNHTKVLRLLFSALLVVMLVALSGIIAGCTQYASNGLFGGFQDTRLDDDVFQISFQGNGFTTAERAQDLAMLRASELTLQYGYKYFEVVKSNIDLNRQTFTSATTSKTDVSVHGNRAEATTTTYGGDTYNIDNPNVTITIKCSKERPRTNNLVANAKMLSQSLKAKYDIKDSAPTGVTAAPGTRQIR